MVSRYFAYKQTLLEEAEWLVLREVLGEKEETSTSRSKRTIAQALPSMTGTGIKTESSLAAPS